MPKNQNLPPYYDDFDATKNYHQILFKPGVSVQARELTQLQSILQNQIERFGNHVFKSGSKVTGGEVFVNQNVISVKLQDSYSGSQINVQGAEGKFLKGRTTGTIGEAVMAISSTSVDPNTVVYQIRTPGSAGGMFADAEIIDVFDDQACTSATGLVVQAVAGTSVSTTGSCVKFDNKVTVSSATGINIGDQISHPNIPTIAYVMSIQGNNVYTNVKMTMDVSGETIEFKNSASKPSSVVSIAEGVFFVEGYFVYCEPQQIILDKYLRTSSYVVGLRYSVQTISAEEDESLLDNSQGSFNYAAPGADRLYIPLVLDKIAITDNSATDADFFELARIVEGSVERLDNKPIYSEIGKTMARRTFEESGNYIVRPFVMNLRDDTRFSSALLAEMSAGKAYVNGEEIETKGTIPVRLDRAQDFESVTGFDVASFYGSYAKVSAPTKGLPQIGTGITVELHNNTTAASGTKIGTANVRFLTYDSGTGASAVYRAYLFNISLTGTNTFGTVRSLVTLGTAANYGTVNMQMNIDASGIVSSAAQLYESGYPRSVFDVPQNFIKTVSSVSYKTRRVFKNVQFSSGQATITTTGGSERFTGGSGAIPTSEARTHYAVVVTTSSGTFTAGTFVPLDTGSRTVTVPVPSSGSAAQATINLNDGTFNGQADIVATIDITGDVRRVKALVQDATLAVSAPATTMSLLKSDVYKIKAIYMSPNLSTNATTSHTLVTDRYTLDNGQRDTHYDHGSITLKAGQAAATGRLLIVFDYFTHSGGTGFFSVDSYAIAYKDIPTYVDSAGLTHELRDCLDFRPRRTDGSTSMAFDTFQMPDPSSVDTTHSYYLQRIDKIALSADGQFKVLRGVSSYNNPQPPADLADGMTLYTLELPAYTLSASQVKVTAESNRRYTMRDIANMDRRLTNVEYYAALNTLEKSVLDRGLSNTSGETLFKNGFLVDSFIDFSVGDVGHADYKCSIDPDRGFARPPFKLNNVALAIETGTTTAKKTGDLITAPFTEVPFISQKLASKYRNVNPFNVLSNVGFLKLTPSSDIWYDTNTLPVINVTNENSGAFKTAQEQAALDNNQAQWSAWNTTWSGYIGTSVRTKTVKEVTSQTTVTENSAVVSTDVVPYMREKLVQFEVTGLTPLSSIFVFMDGKNLSGYVTPSAKPFDTTGVISFAVTNGGSGYTTAPTVTLTGGNGTGASAFAVIKDGKVVAVKATTYGTGYTVPPSVSFSGGSGTGAAATASLTVCPEGMKLVTDVRGRCAGVLRIPAESEMRFTTGTKRIIFSDNTDSPLFAASFADTQFVAQGYISNTQRTVVSTRTPVITSKTVSETNTVDNTPAYEPVYDTYVPRTFIDSDWTMEDFTARVVASTGASYATAAAVAAQVVAGYNSAGASTPERSYGSQTGLPDAAGAVYWATQAIQTGANATQMVTSAIQQTVSQYGGNASAAYQGSYRACTLDPLAQTFFVDAGRNPQGIFVSSIDLFFASKDSTNPVIVELRPTVNGFPSSDTIIPFTQISKNPENVNVSETGTVATKFTFDAPVYLAPGEYSVVIKTNCNKYNMFVAEMGAVILGQNKVISEQPYIGSLFMSQNASTWTAMQTEDLCFVLNKCQFQLGTTTATLKSNAVTSAFDYDLSHLTSQHLDFGTSTDLFASVKTKDKASGTLGSFEPVLANRDQEYTSRKTVAAASDVMVEYKLTTRSVDVSPVIDLERSSVILVQNVVNGTADVTVAETTAYGGNAKAKYVSKPVTLVQGFDADNLVVYLNVNRPAGTKIDVYYKVKNLFDNTNFLDRPWVLMGTETNGGSTSKTGEYVEDKYSAYGITYAANGTTYNDFRIFQIKVVMHSDNPSVVPSITDLRVIAAS